MPQVGGGTIDLANLRGKPVWVNFMATWCPPCQDEFPLMNGFAARYASTGLVVIAIDVKEDEGAVAAFAERLGATFPLGLDTDGAAAASWDAVALPVHFWIDADGIVRDGALGGIGPDVMARGPEDDPAGGRRHALTASVRRGGEPWRRPGPRRERDGERDRGRRRLAADPGGCSSWPTSTAPSPRARAIPGRPRSSRSHDVRCGGWPASPARDPSGWRSRS